MSWAALAMAGLAIVSVGLWTLRVALAARGRKTAGAVVAAAEAVVFALVFSNLAANLGSWDRVAGYAAGVAVGTVFGLAANDRLSRGGAVVEVVVAGDGGALLDAFRERGWPATAMPAAGVNGAATVLFLVVHAGRAVEVTDVVHATAPDALWTVRPVCCVHGVPGMATRESV